MSVEWTWSKDHGDYYYYRLRPGTEPPQYDLIWARSQLNTPQPPAPAPSQQPSFTSNTQHGYFGAPTSNVSPHGNMASHLGLQNNAYTNQRSYSSGPGIGTNPAYGHGHGGFGTIGYGSTSGSSSNHTHPSTGSSTFAGSAGGTQPTTEVNQNYMASAAFASSDAPSDDEAAREAPGFETVREPKRFLKKGRIFETPTEIEGKVRRYVVIRPKSKHCLCLAIRTYSRMATAKPGVNADDHAPLVCGQRQVELHPNERPLRKERLSVVVEEDSLRLNPMARLDFGRVFTIDHKDVHVRSVGRIDSQSMALLEDYFRAGIGVDEPED